MTRDQARAAIKQAVAETLFGLPRDVVDAAIEGGPFAFETVVRPAAIDVVEAGVHAAVERQAAEAEQLARDGKPAGCG